MKKNVKIAKTCVVVVLLLILVAIAAWIGAGGGDVIMAALPGHCLDVLAVVCLVFLVGAGLFGRRRGGGR